MPSVSHVIVLNCWAMQLQIWTCSMFCSFLCTAGLACCLCWYDAGFKFICRPIELCWYDAGFKFISRPIELQYFIVSSIKLLKLILLECSLLARTLSWAYMRTVPTDPS